jgi:hypothetical protein
MCLPYHWVLRPQIFAFDGQEGKRRESGHHASSPLQDFVNESLLRLLLLLCHAPKFRQHPRMDADRNQPLGLSTARTADTPGAPQFEVGCFRNVGEVDAPIWNMPYASSGLPAGH